MNHKKKNRLYYFGIGLALICVALVAFTLYHDSDQKTCGESDTLIVGTNAEFPPFSFIENNTIVGFDIDIMKEVAQRMGKNIEWKDMPFDALIPEIQLGNIHMIAAGMTPTPERAQRVLFTTPYIGGNPLVIISLAINPISSVTDLYGKDVIVNEGFVADEFMSKISGPILHRLPTVAEAFLALKSDRAFAFVVAQRAAQPFLQKYGENHFHTVEIPNTSETSALMISKKYPELLTGAQVALDAMQADGTLTTIKQTWNMHD
jgi:ABC-type amino acid transport substrate-binding protein